MIIFNRVLIIFSKCSEHFILTRSPVVYETKGPAISEAEHINML